jgi:hypothetical protein
MTYDPNNSTVPEQEPEPETWSVIGDKPAVQQVWIRGFPDLDRQLQWGWVDKPRNRHERRAQAAKGRRG